MREDSGRHLDPGIIVALETAMPRILGIIEEHKRV
jgi:hypothetical protein